MEGIRLNNAEIYLAELVKASLNDTVPSDVPACITFDEILEISIRNHMEYMLLSTLVKTNLPEEKKELLRARVKASMMRTLVQMNEIKHLKECFEKEQIVNQPMKGAYMKSIYPTPMLREMSDIDILILDQYTQKVHKIFVDSGYSFMGREHHHDVYVKRPYLIVEAHWTMYDQLVDKNQYEYFSDFSKAVLVEDASYTYNFNKEDFYVYMMAHMAKHFYKRGCGIRNIVDVYVYRNKYKDQLDEKYIDRELNKCGIYSFTKHIERLSRIWLGGEQSTEFYDNLFAYMLDSGIYGKDENGIWNEFAKESDESRFHYRMKLKLFYFFPPYHYMVKYHPWVEEKKFLLPAAWVVRAVTGIAKKKGEEKREMLQHIDQEDIKVIQKIYKEMQFDFN